MVVRYANGVYCRRYRCRTLPLHLKPSMAWSSAQPLLLMGFRPRNVGIDPDKMGIHHERLGFSIFFFSAIQKFEDDILTFSHQTWRLDYLQAPGG